MKYLPIIALVLSTQAMAFEPSNNINDLAKSCAQYGMFALSSKDLKTGEVVYSTFLCRHMFDSDKHPDTRVRESTALAQLRATP